MASSLDPKRIEFPDDAMVEILRRKTPAERLAIAFQCNRMMRLRLAGHFQTRHPDWTAEQINRAVATRMLDGDWSDVAHQ
jgi:hypothetical protein